MAHPLPDEDTMYAALVNKDSKFEGIFVAAIKTTGIFCRPTCTARKPKRENVEFFSSAQEALDRGYRPCKLCHPLAHKGAVPDWLKPLWDEIEANPMLRLKDQDLRDRDLDPSRVRRWFKKHHGVTFHAYMRGLQVGQAFDQIRNGDQVTTSAFETGYESLSGFADAFKKATGFAPSESQNAQVIMTKRILTPLGPMLAGATDAGICLLEFMDRRMLDTQLKRLHKLLDAAFVPGASPHLDELEHQLAAYFAGQQREFTLPLVVPGTPFQRKVWDELRNIPYGSTCAYQELAARIERPTAVRAVAKTNGDNRIAILIPCHRVIGKDGKLTGYGGGLWRKQHLLDLESAHVKPLE